MKPLYRLILKQGCDEWRHVIEKEGGVKSSFLKITDRKFPWPAQSSGTVKTSDYHGICILETPYFIILLSMFPYRTEEVKDEYQITDYR